MSLIARICRDIIRDARSVESVECTRWCCNLHTEQPPHMLTIDGIYLYSQICFLTKGLTDFSSSSVLSRQSARHSMHKRTFTKR